ncbi:NAD-dependent epimerase/dehydratase family protein [Candidatus Daviesbacteria bacterium]|nr:NAD-dependent epimerase/dehydratase family protein [Candidatus Daviesbacteria bacterium]
MEQPIRKRVVITGGAGLVGTECCRLFADRDWEVISVDNYLRGHFFGEEGSTRDNIDDTLKVYPNIRHIEGDIRDNFLMTEVIRGCDAVIHTASQPSHPRSIEIPLEDFSVNASGTLNLLEITRQQAPRAVFIFCSSDKVYGENSNLPVVEKATRYDYIDRDGIDETMTIDQTIHTPFGVSKVAGDLYTQEYAKLYGLTAGVFRMGCITGASAKAVELHNWEPHFIKKNMSGETLNIFGFGGKQVRDVIHARDLALLFWEFVQSPRRGEVYNVGGGRKNSISLLESFDLIESITGKKMKWQLKEAREGDHQVYISDISKVKSHYPNWDIRIGLPEIFRDIYNALLKKQADHQMPTTQQNGQIKPEGGTVNITIHLNGLKPEISVH